MKSKDATPLVMKELNRNGKKWFIQIPLTVSNVDEVTRRATRRVDPLEEISVMDRLRDLLNEDRKFGYLLVSLCLFAVVAFVLALEYGWIELVK